MSINYINYETIKLYSLFKSHLSYKMLLLWYLSSVGLLSGNRVTVCFFRVGSMALRLLVAAWLCSLQ